MNDSSPATRTTHAAGRADWLAADEAALDYIATRIAPKFGVSSEVIAKRLRVEELGRLIIHEHLDDRTS